MHPFKRFWQDRAGTTALEYGLIIGLISLVIVAGMANLGTVVGNLFTNNSDKVGQALQ